MKKPREFWIFTHVDDSVTGVSEKKPSSIRGAVCRGPDIHVIEKLAYDKAIRKLQESEAALESVRLDKLAQLSVLEDKIAIAVEALVTLESHVYAYGIEQESFAVAMACEKTKKALRKINSSHNVHSHRSSEKWWGRTIFEREGIEYEHEYSSKPEAEAYKQGFEDAKSLTSCEDDDPLEEYFADASNQVSHIEGCSSLRGGTGTDCDCSKYLQHQRGGTNA